MPGPADRGGQGHGDRTRGRRHAPARHTRCFPKGMMHQRAMSSEYNSGAWDMGAANTRASSTLEAHPHSWRTHGGPCHHEQTSPRKPGTGHTLSVQHETPATGRCLFLPAKLRSTRLWCEVSDHTSASSATEHGGSRDPRLHVPPAPVLRDRPEEATTGLVCAPPHV